jgi:hypothetical protein
LISNKTYGLQRRLADFARDFIAKTKYDGAAIDPSIHELCNYLKSMGDIAVAHESHLLNL